MRLRGAPVDNATPAHPEACLTLMGICERVISFIALPLCDESVQIPSVLYLCACGADPLHFENATAWCPNSRPTLSSVSASRESEKNVSLLLLPRVMRVSMRPLRCS